MNKNVGTYFPLDRVRVSKYPSQTRSLRSFQSSLDGGSSGCVRSHPAAELFLTKKTQLPCLLTVCSGHPDTLPNNKLGVWGARQILNFIILLVIFILVQVLPVIANDVIYVADYSISLSDWKLKEFTGKASFQVKGAPRKMVTLISSQSSFALAKELRMTLSTYPFINFEWNIEKLPDGGDVRNKNTDDQGGQVYVIISSFPEMINYKAIGYIWDSAAPAGKYQSTKSGNVKYVVLRSGKDGLGQWHHEKRNVYQDFKELWGIDLNEERKVIVSINIDSDDTKSSATASYGNIFFTQNKR
jgi:hypothetical protein